MAAVDGGIGATDLALGTGDDGEIISRHRSPLALISATTNATVSAAGRATFRTTGVAELGASKETALVVA